MAVDMGGVNLLDFFKEGFAFETLVFGCELMAFVNFPLFDDCTAFSHLSVLAGNLFLGAYPLPCLVIKYAYGGNLYIGLGKQLPFTEDKVDVVVGLFLVMMESRYTFHIVPSVKFLCEIFKHLLRLIGGVNFGQGDNQLPCFNTPSPGVPLRLNSC